LNPIVNLSLIEKHSIIMISTNLNFMVQDNHGHFAVKQCPHCDKIWQRDVNACRQTIIFNSGILVSFKYQCLCQNFRPHVHGQPKDGEIDVFMVGSQA
jgi:hypothetical protein